MCVVGRSKTWLYVPSEFSSFVPTRLCLPSLTRRRPLIIPDGLPEGPFESHRALADTLRGAGLEEPCRGWAKPW